jgi:hypothetical protein
VARRWFYERNGKTLGPVAAKELIHLAEQGGLSPQDLIWAEGFSKSDAAPAEVAIRFVDPIAVVPPHEGPEVLPIVELEPYVGPIPVGRVIPVAEAAPGSSAAAGFVLPLAEKSDLVNVPIKPTPSTAMPAKPSTPLAPEKGGDSAGQTPDWLEGIKPGEKESRAPAIKKLPEWIKELADAQEAMLREREAKTASPDWLKDVQ